VDAGIARRCVRLVGAKQKECSTSFARRSRACKRYASPAPRSDARRPRTPYHLRMAPRRVSLLLALAFAVSACSSDAVPGGSVAPSQGSGAPAATNPLASSPASDAPTRAPSVSVLPAPIPPPEDGPLPRPGTYLYAQQGSETFCSTAACSTPRPLPSTMTVTLRYGGRIAGRPDAHRLDITMDIAQGRTVRVKAASSQTDVLVEHIEAEFSESGITRSGSVRPSPAIPLLSFPLREGEEVSRSFRDGDTAGRFTRKVAGRETINAQGRQQPARKVESTLTTTGDRPASIAITMWIDERSRTFLRLAVEIDVPYEITRYKASFTDTLQSAPASR